MAKFKIEKEPLQPHFLGLNIDNIGSASGCLKHCGLKLYLYLMSNSDGFTWNMNPVAFANWLGADYSNASEARKVRKTISDGILDLRENGFLKEDGLDAYVISEQIVPEWLGSNLGTKSSTQELLKEQIVPKMVEAKIITSEQIVPEKHSSSLGTNCSEQDAQKEKIVPDCYGF
jgi:hypothetical protein